MAYFVYVLRSLKNGQFYTGSTEDLEKRLIRHNSGETGYTRTRRPFELVYSESFSTRGDAIRREKELKSGKGRDELRRKLCT